MEDFRERLSSWTMATSGKGFIDCSPQEQAGALAKALMQDIVPRWNASRAALAGKKKASYLSAEYLMGRTLGNTLMNLRVDQDVAQTLEAMGLNLNVLEEAEPDAGLGNGGLGRLAACFLDSAATHGYPLNGYGIRYEFGIFKQRFVDGFQIEDPDPWLAFGDPWSLRRAEEAVKVSFADGQVLAIPYDTPVVGYGGKVVNTLRLWKAEALVPFDLEQFNLQHYDLAVREKNWAETITKVLYPNDSSDQGKILRLRQQYFFVSASLQDLIADHKAQYGNLERFAELNAIQLNDTHPAVAIPELMRLLTAQEGMSWKKAWEMVTRTFAYTNHTILAEALETWDIRLYKKILPHVYAVMLKINAQLLRELKARGVDKVDLEKYEILHGNRIRMAYLSIYGSFSVNGVAALHTNLLIHSELKDWYALYPERFNNKTNGITQRRWLLKANPELAALITELLGSDQWITDLEVLRGLESFAEDPAVLERFLEIKALKKRQLADFILAREGIEIDPNAIFDIQIKRLHEYKRQLLNAFHILDLYYRLKKDPSLERVPRVFIFGAKAAPGYVRAKGIIKYIQEVKKLVNGDPDMAGKLKVVFVENYDVSYGEKLFPAADVSEQTSTAGKEASGTGNMKFMLSGAPTLGTFDGANIEIVEEAGEENNFIFGLRVEEIQKIKDRYVPAREFRKTKGLKKVVDSLVDGTFSDGGTGMFRELHDALLLGADWHTPDVFMILKDFASYREAQQRVNDAYLDRMGWARKCWMNLAGAGKFSSDRTIAQYAKEIWGIEPLLEPRLQDAEQRP